VFCYRAPASVTALPALVRLELLQPPPRGLELPALRSFACNAPMPFAQLEVLAAGMPQLEVRPCP
jgi:hypothetical protein